MMEITLAERKALVTGSTVSRSALGYAIAKRLAQSGASGVVHGRNRERVAEAVERLHKEVPQADVAGVAADLTSEEGLNLLVSEAREVDVLVNNAGTPEPKPFFDITDGDWERHARLHLLGAARLCRHYARGMVERGWGRILFNASTTGGFGSGEMVHYGATKAALLGLSRGLAESVAKTGVTVNCFIPGPTRERTETAVQGKVADPAGMSFDQMEAEIFADLPTSLIGRFADPAEVASLVAFLASDLAAPITGAAIRVDGGITRCLV
jgi:NAD(P)-dependent dehydrogenase (short-subunit alcohol dehydrogenase family)